MWTKRTRLSPGFLCEVRGVAQSLVFCEVLCGALFVLFKRLLFLFMWLLHLLFLFWFMTSDYHLVIFKLFLSQDTSKIIFQRLQFSAGCIFFTCSLNHCVFYEGVFVLDLLVLVLAPLYYFVSRNCDSILFFLCFNYFFFGVTICSLVMYMSVMEILSRKWFSSSSKETATNKKTIYRHARNYVSMAILHHN